MTTRIHQGLGRILPQAFGRMVLALILGAPLLVAWPKVALASTQLGSDAITVVVTPQERSVDLGEMVDLNVTVTNAGIEPVSNLTAHIDITNLASELSVDPEDWTPTLSLPVGPLEPGESVIIAWSIQPISAGTFTLYAVALSPAASSGGSVQVSSAVHVSNTLTIDVTDQRSLNPQGVLPVSLATPAIIGLALLDRVRRNRRG